MSGLSGKETGFYLVLSMYCWARGGWVVEDDALVTGLCQSFKSDEETVRSFLIDDDSLLSHLIKRENGLLSTALVIDCLTRRRSDG